MSFKPAELRTPEKTKDQIYEHLRLATLPGGSQKVKDATATTGIRDTATAAIVDCLLEMGKSLRKRETGKQNMSEDQIRAKLEKELEELLIKSDINPLIGMPGAFRSISYCDI